MKLSVIIPSRPSNRTLRLRALRSLEAAAEGLDVETVLVEDADGRGAAWARNRGLARATGAYVWFCDDDDAVRPGFFRRPLARLVETGADLCLFQCGDAPLGRDYELVGNAAVRAALLPAFYGYSFDDVRRWNAGGDLAANREPGSVWRVAFRRDFLERNALRFREGLALYEDAFFLAECALAAERVTSLRETLYDYLPNPAGTTATVTGTPRHADYKFEVLRLRRALDARHPGTLGYCEASLVFSALELLRARAGARRYLADGAVRAALGRFPLAGRHPLVALGVLFLRALARTVRPSARADL